MIVEIQKRVSFELIANLGLGLNLRVSVLVLVVLFSDYLDVG